MATVKKTVSTTLPEVKTRLSLTDDLSMLRRFSSLRVLRKEGLWMPLVGGDTSGMLSRLGDRMERGREGGKEGRKEGRKRGGRKEVR